MLEPQSTALFIVLMTVFCGLLACVALARETALRVLAASLAFVPAMLFGVAAVNKFYNYYQNWGSVTADLTGQTGTGVAAVAGSQDGLQLSVILSRVVRGGRAAAHGETVRFTVTGRSSHLTRTVYVYLPPQYFRPAYRSYRFPAIELITGQPGEPQDWINVVGITHTFLTLLSDGVVRPAVLIMPDANGGRQFSLQCLDIPHGPQDARFLATDVPGYFTRVLRLQPPGRAWGLAGYSEGGYCTANLALTHPRDYGMAGVLSGYFRPDDVRSGSPPRTFYPFRTRGQRRLNTPLIRVRTLPVNVVLPQFWLGAGSRDGQDVVSARAFQRLLLARQPGIQLHLAPGGGHTMTTWRALMPPLLEWMTPALARAASASAPGHVVQHASSSRSRVSPAVAGSASP